MRFTNSRATPSTGAIATPSTGGAAIFNPIEIQQIMDQYGIGKAVSDANGVVNDSNMAQIQQLLQLLNVTWLLVTLQETLYTRR